MLKGPLENFVGETETYVKGIDTYRTHMAVEVSNYPDII